MEAAPWMGPQWHIGSQTAGGHREPMATHKAASKPLKNTKSVHNLVLDFPAFSTARNDFLLFIRNLVYGNFYTSPTRLTIEISMRNFGNYSLHLFMENLEILFSFYR